MPNVGSEIDASFYCLIHRMLVTPRDEAGGERRLEKRNLYRVVQRIAPWDGSKFPAETEFVQVQCHDLTRAGFSFVAPTEPHFRTLVVEFGVLPDVLYVAAQVLRSVPVLWYPSGRVARMSGPGSSGVTPGESGEKGRPMFLVACRLTRRLRRPI
jgi:hypothetical protein